MILKSEEEIDQMRASALLVSKTLSMVAGELRAGISTLMIDKLIHQFICDHKAVPSFLNYHGYPFSSCISVNDVVVHGFPNEKPLQMGDVISIDVGVVLNGWHGDHAYTFCLGQPPAVISNLINVTKESLYKGIEKAIAGNRVGDISYAIQEHTEKKHGYGAWCCRYRRA